MKYVGRFLSCSFVVVVVDVNRPSAFKRSFVKENCVFTASCKRLHPRALEPLILVKDYKLRYKQR